MPDTRIATNDFGTSPLNTVVAVDSRFARGNAQGSGITIAPNHVLTVDQDYKDREHLSYKTLAFMLLLA
jgi:hypothetical protein